MNLHKEFTRFISGYNNKLRPETVFGVHVAKYIGDICPDNPQKILVELEYDMQVYAQVLYSFPFLSIPSKEWLEKFDDPLFCYVGFEQGKMERPVILGFFFKKAKIDNLPQENYPRNFIGYFENFIVSIDDVKKVLALQKVDEEGKLLQEILIRNDFIEGINHASSQSFKVGETFDLGKQEALEKAPLGETLKEELSSMLDKLGDIQGIPTPAGPSGPLKSAPNFSPIIKGIKSSFEKFLSKNIRYD